MTIIYLISILIIAALSAALRILSGLYRKFFKDNLENAPAPADTGADTDTREPRAGLVTPFTVSFGEYMTKISLPAILFDCRGKELLFILDTGSNGSHINRSALAELGIDTRSIEQKEGVEPYVATGNGVAAPSAEQCDLVLSLDAYKFNVTAYVDDLDSAFDRIFKSDGVRIHGILGTNFLKANNWTLDFANNVAYPAFQTRR